MQEFSYLTAFTVGLLGGVHCIGMCGGIVGALSFGLSADKQQAKTSSNIFSLLLAYNGGRLFSYALAGGLMGGLGWLLAYWLDIRSVQIALQFFAAVFMLLLGLYLAGWWSLLAKLEKAGGFIWKYLEPVARNYIPVSNLRHALTLGLLWGWLPCGLVYSVLIWAIAAGSFQQGALLMLSFGLGTLPNLLAMGLFATQLHQWVRRTGVRQFAGIMVIGFGLWNLVLLARY
ncbi:MAG: sulfite exporter TauE/SafE family protein [Gammaproteobacteria bacterium]|nr:sulfite exporter TauE/SafE family protein [Gammaproteobacteria bacterium]